MIHVRTVKELGNQDTRLAAEVVVLINSKQSELTEKLGSAGLDEKLEEGLTTLRREKATRSLMTIKPSL